MYHLSDKELDRLAKEAAEQFDVQQSTSGWEALEKQLNDDLPKDERRRRRWLLLLLLFISVGSGGTLIYLLTSETGTETNKPQAQNSPGDFSGSNKLEYKSDSTIGLDKHDTRDHADGITASGEEKNAVESTTGQSLPKGKKVDGQETIIVVRDHDPQEATKPPTGNSAKSNPKKTLVSRNQPRTFEQTSIQKRQDPITPPRSNQNNNNLSANKSEDEFIRTAVVRLPELYTPINSIWKATSATKLNSESITPAPEQTSIQKKASGKVMQKGFEIGIIAAPDMSNVGFTHKVKPGFNLGISASYRLSQRFSIVSGLIYTQKIYTAKGSDYHPPKGYWTYNTTLHSVEGDCYMFDIPVNLRYDLNLHERSRFFVSGGLSSYLMKKETYNFHYTYNGVYGTREREYESDENHLFSVVNFSTGFETRLARKLTMQFEPYIKVPVVGLGFGSIKLNSYGVYFGLKYKPFAR